MMTANVTVRTSARLHMGFFDLNGGLGRKFGSLGLSLEEPSLVIGASAASFFDVVGENTVPAETIMRASVIAQQLAAKLKVPDTISWHIMQHIPEHAGLGSGTQLVLAIGAALSHIYGLRLTTPEIAALSGRGERSGIGIAAFDYGGLLIDGGRISHASTRGPAVPPLLARYHFPEDWRILLIFDANKPGVHGEQERVAFNQLPVFSEALAAHLCRHVLMQAMPAMVERDLVAFGNTIRELQTHVGDYFAPAQGGRYASQLVAKALQYLEQTGVACLGQSSWGPTGFAVLKNALEADNQLQQLSKLFAPDGLTFKVCSARNQGAAVLNADLAL